MAPKSSGKSAKGGGRVASDSSSAASSSAVAVASGNAGAGADEVTLLRLYKRCMDGKPRDKLTSLGAADRALQELQAAWKDRPSRLACLLLVRPITLHPDVSRVPAPARALPIA